MSILSGLLGSYGDDAIRTAGKIASNKADDVLLKAATNKAGDVAGMAAKQAAKATAKVGKSTAAQQIAKNEFDDYLTSLGATPTLRKQMANEAYNGVLGKTGMANRFKTLNVDLANVADKSAAGLNAYGKVMNNLYDYMDNAGVGVDLSGLQNSGSKLFTKAQKNRLLQSGLDIDEVLKGTVSANQANDLYKLSRELSLKYKKAGVNNAIDGAIGDQLKTFATQIRDKLDETASTVSKSFGLKQQLVDAANSIDDIEVARALSGMTDDAITASTIRSEMAPYMKMKDFIGLQAPKEKTLNVLGVDTGITNPLPKATKAIQNTALKAKDKLSSDTGKNAVTALGAGGIGLLGGLLGASALGRGNKQPTTSMSTLGGLTSGDSMSGFGGMSAMDAMNESAPSQQATLGGYTYDDLENAYVAAIMAGDSESADVIADMIGMLDARVERTKSATKSSGGDAKAQSALNTLEELYRIYQSFGGSQGVVKGNITKALNAVSGGAYSPAAATFDSVAQGSIGRIVKAMGDSGALSDTDKQNALKMIPKVSDSPELAEQKFQSLYSLLMEAAQGE